MLEQVKDYYGRQLQSSADLKTSACCDLSDMPAWLLPLLGRIHPDVLSRYYGCGLVCPPLLDGARVLDLGCGSGRDVYLLAQLVGPSGSVTGIDMTGEQLAIAEAHHEHHADTFGYDNVTFRRGYIERLEELELAPASFDVVVSNCVVNLSLDKDAVLRGVRRLLRPGGELRIATDHPVYLEWTLVVMQRHRDDFTWLAEKPADFLEPPSGWIETRYGAKSRREGRRPYYLRYRRS